MKDEKNNSQKSSSRHSNLSLSSGYLFVLSLHRAANHGIATILQAQPIQNRRDPVTLLLFAHALPPQTKRLEKQKRPHKIKPGRKAKIGLKIDLLGDGQSGMHYVLLGQVSNELLEVTVMLCVIDGNRSRQPPQLTALRQ